jgi:ribokinase
MPSRPRIAVLGHVEHVTLGTVPALPQLADILHLEETVVIPGGGGGVTFFQLTRAPAEVLLFTAIGQDSGGAEMEARVRATGAEVHVARRSEAHTRDVVLLTPDGERTILVVGQPLHPRRDDPLPYERLAGCDAAYFTAYDPELIREARHARLLVVTARRRESLVRSGVRADLVVGSRRDPREASTLADYPVRPGALVMTDGAHGGTVETEAGVVSFRAPASPAAIRSSYGAGDSFVGALMWLTVLGLPLVEACERAGAYGAAVLASVDPLAAQLPLPAAASLPRPTPA